jgi:hypothetical protein
MSESRERWDMISRRLQTAVKAGTADRSEGFLDQHGDDWPCWVPTSECLTLDGTEAPQGVGS